MATITQKMHVSHQPKQMFDLVCAVEEYPMFVTACVNGAVINQGDGFDVVRLSFEKKGVSYSFTTKNTLSSPDKVHMELVDGPFRYLRGDWTFEPVTDGCVVAIHVDYEFNNVMLKMMFQSMFQQLIVDLLESFCQRADKVYA
mgnify:CR=1 FL=1